MTVAAAPARFTGRTALLTAAATALEVTPWQLDHAVWNHQRRRR